MAMEQTPLSSRTHVSIFGAVNAGKSALFNKLLGQDMAIVSKLRGTTTDPVTKAMELIPYGPIAVTDTAGLGDTTAIGGERMKKTEKILNRTDFAIYAADPSDFDETAYNSMKVQFEKRRIGHILVFTKSDLGSNGVCERYPDALHVSVRDDASIERLRSLLCAQLSKYAEQSNSMIGGLLPAGATAVLVIPIDSEAPKGRLILPQVQLIRDCLDHGIKAVCVRGTELAETLKELPHVDLVVTDSQAFKFVSETVPSNTALTSFSILLAGTKGDLREFIRGAEAIKYLKDGSRILMAEACTHNVSHEDIGRIKIPALIRKHTGAQPIFDYCVGYDFPENISDYDLVIHCGGCMINSRAVMNRTAVCRENGVPITNYGIAIAYLSGILERSKAIFGI